MIETCVDDHWLSQGYCQNSEADASADIDLPRERGPLTLWLLGRLRGAPPRGSSPVPSAADGFTDDLQLALYLCYESHYCELPGRVGDWEWDPEIIAFRRHLEAAFEDSLSGVVGDVESHRAVREIIPEIIANDDGPSVSRHMDTDGTLDEMREFLVHRSAYQLKEADPHTFAIPRLDGRAKQLLVEIQAGEYGAGDVDRIMHSQLFAQTMRSVGLDDRRNAYLDALPASALMISNLVSLFALNRRWRGALVGQLAVFEMTSVVPMGRYARGLDRMGAEIEARRFYDVHVLADAEHEVMALEMAGALADAEPALVGDIVFGARASIVVERLFAEQLFSNWRAPRGAHAAA